MSKNAYIDELTLITIPFSELNIELYECRLMNLITKNDMKIKNVRKNEERWRYEIFLVEPIPLGYPYQLIANGNLFFDVKIGQVVRTKLFDDLYFYDKNDLGVTYTKSSTVFKLWAPTASNVQLVFYPSEEKVSLFKGDKGTWHGEVAGDLEGRIYMYRLLVDNVWREAVDPYARAVTVNGEKGVIVDLASTNPLQWPIEKPPFQQPTDAIIYEVHVRDFTIDENSGSNYKGKYKGLIESKTRGPWDTLTGLDYLKDLGITHVQLLPIQDFGSVNELEWEDTYNWGYDTVHFNAIEGSYSLNPENPKLRINELKDVINTFHEHGIRVILDVVYNHVYIHEKSSFEKIVPGYYFRYQQDGKLADGTGVGNDIASERKMVRKFIVDSVLFLAKEYQVDGFRFDLMGNLDVATMVEIQKQLFLLDSTILVLGEGWNLATPLSDDKKATIANSDQLPRISHFNDQFRDKLKGNIFDKSILGFCNGNGHVKEELKMLVSGSTKKFHSAIEGIFSEPYKSVNYVECHDNHTLWDRLALTNGHQNETVRKKMHRLATTITILSQGIPFLHAGQEFYRSKSGVENSYNSPDEINKINWTQKALNMDYVDYVKGLIALRKKYDVFRFYSVDRLIKSMHILEAPSDCLAYLLRDQHGMFTVAYNSSQDERELILPSRGKWCVLVDEKSSAVTPLRQFEEGKVVIKPISAIVLYHEKNY